MTADTRVPNTYSNVDDFQASYLIFRLYVKAVIEQFDQVMRRIEAAIYQAAVAARVSPKPF